MAINIIKEKCIGCGQCFKSCPKDAFYFEPYDGHVGSVLSKKRRLKYRLTWAITSTFGYMLSRETANS